jgi:histidinol-phosphate/aromatic aminotransferase/cobyric acid decarboxylase-like protein
MTRTDRSSAARDRAVKTTQFCVIISQISNSSVFSAAQGNFVFFDAGRRHGDMTAALAARDIAIKQSYPALPTWLRISIGLPDDNVLARQVVADSLR